MSDFDDAEAAAESYEVVAADSELSAAAPHSWILVEQGDESIAFLSPEAASETVGRTPRDYLRGVRVGFTGDLFAADLTDSEQLFRDRLGFGDPMRAVVVFDPDQLERLDLVAPPDAEPLALYCPKGVDPIPPGHCAGCYCSRRGH